MTVWLCEDENYNVLYVCATEEKAKEIAEEQSLFFYDMEVLE